MKPEPFVYVPANVVTRRRLSVPPGHEGFVVHAGGRLRLPPGMHRLTCAGVESVVLVRAGGSHAIDLRCLGGVLLRGSDGRRRPMKVLGRLRFGVERADLLADMLERERICEPRDLERELARAVVELLCSVFDGDSWRPDDLVQNLDTASGELQSRVASVLAPLGLALHGLELLAEPAPLQGAAAPGGF